jgi:plastocyanin
MFSEKFRFMAAVLAVALTSLAAAACNGGDKQAVPAGPPPGAQRVDEARAGQVTGRVILEGGTPENPLVKISSDPTCTQENPEGLHFEDYVVKDGGLDNVLVYVKDGLGKYYFDVPTAPVKLDQQGCRYLPHVFGARVGQPIEIVNSDETMHNVHAMPKVNREFNFGQPIKGMKNTEVFTTREVMVEFTCNVHPWMKAYGGIVDHPYFAVTSGGGKFELKNLPAGTYTVEAWHEKMSPQTQTVTIGEKETKQISFTFKSVPGNRP